MCKYAIEFEKAYKTTDVEICNLILFYPILYCYISYSTVLNASCYYEIPNVFSNQSNRNYCCAWVHCGHINLYSLGPKCETQYSGNS